MQNALHCRRVTPSPGNPSEDGFILLGVIILMALFIIAMSVAAPKMARDIQRDRDLETMRRGKQYIRAVQLYYKKFSAYPPNVDALVKTNEIRFLRKRYIDPTTGKNEWKIIQFGQNKMPIAYGLFGQPLGGAGGSVVAGTGPSGGNGVAGATDASGIGLSSGSSSSSAFGGSSSFGSSSGSSSPTSSSPFSSGSGSSGTDSSSGSSGSSSGSSLGSLSGQTMGGAGLIGVSPQGTKQSIVVYKTKNHYNEWEFTYSPIMDQPLIAGGNAGAIGQSAGSVGSSIGTGTGSTGTSGSSFGGSSFGGSSFGGSGSSFGSSSPTTTTSPTTPQ